jgi:ABC-type multidrug transport system ATPase subunit
MIEAHELTKRYGDTTAVHSLSFTIAPGTVTGFLGPNGAGKSTTMRMIMGLDWPTSGHRHRQQSPARAAYAGQAYRPASQPDPLVLQGRNAP